MYHTVLQEIGHSDGGMVITWFNQTNPATDPQDVVNVELVCT